MKDQTARLALGRGRGGHVTVEVHVAVERADLATLKVRAPAAKDKVDVARDKTTVKILAPHDARRKLLGANEAARLDLARRQGAAEKRVLMPQQAAAVNHKAVSVGVERQALAHLAAVAGVVFYGQVAQRHIVRVDEHRVRAKSAELAVYPAAVARVHKGAQAIDNAHALGGLAHQGHVGTANLHALAVLAGRNTDLDRHRGIRNLLAGRRKGRAHSWVRALGAHSHPKNPLLVAHTRPFRAHVRLFVV